MVYTQLEKTDFEVLAFLIKNMSQEYSIKEIADKLKRPYVKIHSSIKRLSKQRIVNELIKGKSHYCSIDYKENIGVVCFIEYQIAKDFLKKNKTIKLIIEDITSSINILDYTLLLFGSYAKGNADKNSDIDISIISSDKDKEKAERAINSVKSTFSSAIHSLEFSYEEFLEMLKSKKNTVGKEIVKNHIIFKGCEQFYNSILLSE